MTILWTLSENPNKQLLDNNNFNIKKDIIKTSTEKKLSVEAFNNMSWKEIKENLKVDKNWELRLLGKKISYYFRKDRQLSKM